MDFIICWWAHPRSELRRIIVIRTNSMIRQHICQFCFTQLYTSAETYTNMQINLKVFLLFPIRSLFPPEMSNILPLLLHIHTDFLLRPETWPCLLCPHSHRDNRNEFHFAWHYYETYEIKKKKDTLHQNHIHQKLECSRKTYVDTKILNLIE